MPHQYEARTSDGDAYTVTTSKHHDDHDDATFKKHLLDVIKSSVSGVISGSWCVTSIRATSSDGRAVTPCAVARRAIGDASRYRPRRCRDDSTGVILTTMPMARVTGGSMVMCQRRSGQYDCQYGASIWHGCILPTCGRMHRLPNTAGSRGRAGLCSRREKRQAHASIGARSRFRHRVPQTPGTSGGCAEHGRTGAGGGNAASCSARRTLTYVIPSAMPMVRTLPKARWEC